MAGVEEILREIRRRWGAPSDPGQMPAQVLAYLGDAIYEVYVRLRIVEAGPSRMVDLHRRAVDQVCAETQATVLDRLAPLLSDEEKIVVRRGRNTGTSGRRKANGAAHSQSSGFEALLGYLLLKDEHSRLFEILNIAHSTCETVYDRQQQP